MFTGTVSHGRVFILKVTGEPLIVVGVSVTRNRAWEVFLVGHEEGGDGSRLVPVSAREAGLAQRRTFSGCSPCCSRVSQKRTTCS